MHVISIPLDCKRHIDNFQPVLVAKTVNFVMKKKHWKIFRFLKNWSLWDNIYISVLPSLRRIQKYIFHPCFLIWQDTGVQNVPVIGEISVKVKNDEFLRDITTLFSLYFLLFEPLICLSLFIYTSFYSTSLDDDESKFFKFFYRTGT